MNQAIVRVSSRDILHRWDRLNRVGCYIFFTLISLTSLGFLFVGNQIWGSFAWYHFHFGFPSIPAALSIVAAILYYTAAMLEHGFVFSQGLEGSGVEPMDFTIPGFGPELNSTEGEGNIRL